MWGPWVVLVLSCAPRKECVTSARGLATKGWHSAVLLLSIFVNGSPGEISIWPNEHNPGHPGTCCNRCRNRVLDPPKSWGHSVEGQSLQGCTAPEMGQVLFGLLILHLPVWGIGCRSSVAGSAAHARIWSDYGSLLSSKSSRTPQKSKHCGRTPEATTSLVN